mgnify:CR=1 FL=1|jgi:hypothetical protein
MKAETYVAELYWLDSNYLEQPGLLIACAELLRHITTWLMAQPTNQVTMGYVTFIKECFLCPEYESFVDEASNQVGIDIRAEFKERIDAVIRKSD